MTTDRLVCVKGRRYQYQRSRTRQIGSSSQSRHTKTFGNLFWCGWKDFQHFGGFSTTVGAFFWIVRPNCNQGPTVRFIFCRWHTKSPYSGICKEMSFSYVFVDLFIYFFILLLSFFFCWTQLLGPHHAERPNMALSVNRSPGATRQKTGENHPAKFSARWLPAGIIWGPERLPPPPPSLFPFSCMVSRLESSTLTLLLTQPLRDGCNSSLSMAPVIEPSEREREWERERWRGRENKEGRRRWVRKRERVKLNCNFRAVTVLRAGNSAAVSVSGRTRMPLRAETDLFPHCPDYQHLYVQHETK